MGSVGVQCAEEGARIGEAASIRMGEIGWLKPAWGVKVARAEVVEDEPSPSR